MVVPFSPFRRSSLDPVILMAEPMSHSLRSLSLFLLPSTPSLPPSMMQLMHRGPVAPVYPGK